MSIYEQVRQEPRFNFVREFDATLGRVPIVLCTIAESGMGVRHATPLRPGTEASFRLTLSAPFISVQVGAHVVWSRFSNPGHERPYHSGLRIPDPGGELSRALGTLRDLGMLLPEGEASGHPCAAVPMPDVAPPSLSKRPSHAHIPVSVVQLVNEARGRLLASPAELAQWRERGKVSLLELGEPIPDRDDVLAVWQYLDRSLELATIETLLEE